jgi:phosphohistidine phosphatase
VSVRRLLLLRHAKSSWDEPGLDDHDRPLAPRGRKAGKRVAKELRRREIEVDLVLCSSAVRAQQTYELVAPALGEAEIAIEPELYGASSARLLARLRALDDRTGSALLIGHNPGLQDLAVRLCPAATRIAEHFPTGALAVLEVDGSWADLGPASVALESYVVPREL